VHCASSQTLAGFWPDLFKSKNNVTWDTGLGSVKLQGWTSGTASLAPSAGLLSLHTYDGDIEVNATISVYDILQ